MEHTRHLHQYISLQILFFFCLLLPAASALGADAPWPMLGHDSGRSCYSSIQGIENPGVAPVFPENMEPFEDSAEGNMLAAPGDILILRDGYYPGEHIAFDLKTNKIKWRYPRNLQCTPAIGDDGNIYVYGTNGQPTALDLDTGKLVWEDTQITPANTASPGNIPCIGVDGSGNIYFGISDGIAVYKPGTTKQLYWYYEEGLNDLVQQPAGFTAGPDGTVYIFSDRSCYRLYALTHTGQNGSIKWTYDFTDYFPPSGEPRKTFITLPVISSDGTLYVRQANHVVALKDSGSKAEVLWAKEIEGELQSGDTSFQNGPILDENGYLYVWSETNDVVTIFCLDTHNKGAIVWSKILSEDFGSSINKYLGAHGILYFIGGTSAVGMLVGIDTSTGDIAFQRDYVGSPAGDLAIASDGTLYYTAYYYARDHHYYKNNTIMAVGATTNNAPTITQLSANPTAGNSPLIVDFATTATDFDGDNLTYHWDFGDNGTSSDEDPSHTFTGSGVYEVTLTVTDSQGASTTQTITITVFEDEIPGGGGGSDNQSDALQVSINASPRSGRPPLAVSCDAVPNHLYESLTYTWDFGDGTSGSGKEISHTYTAAGTYSINLIARSTYQTARASARISVVASGREFIAVDCVTVEADAMTCTDAGDTCTLSGNVLINGFVSSSGDVIVSGHTVTGEGYLFITTTDSDALEVSGSGFSITTNAEDDDGNCYGEIGSDAAVFLNLYGIEFEYEGMKLYEDHVITAGSLQLPVDFGTVRITVTLSEEGIDFGGRIDLPDIQIAGFGLSDGYMELDTFLDLWAIGATMKVPGLKFEIGVELGILGGYLNMVHVEVGNINKPILYSPPPAPAPIVFLQSINGGLDNISPEAQDPVVLSAGAGFTGGPEVTLPALNLLNGTLVVGGCSDGCAILGGDVDLEIDTGGRFTAAGTGYLISSDFGTFGSLVLILDVAKGVYFEGTLYYPPGENFAVLTVTGKGKIDFGFNFQASLEGTMKTPGAWWLIGGKTFGSAKAYIDNDLIAAGVKIGDRICVPFVGCANLFIKVSVSFDFEDGAFAIAKNWDNIGEVQFSSGALKMWGAAADQSSPAHSFTLSDNQTAVIFRMEASGSQPSFTLEGPDKTVYAPDSANAFWRKNEELGELWCAVPLPAKGTWNMTVTSSAKTYTLQMLRQNHEPSIAITSLDKDITIEAGDSFNISWTADDPDDDARVSLFYDDDREGENGNLIASGISEADTGKAWNTSGIAPGRYYLYAKIDDGKNSPVFSYSRHAITITRSAFPPPAINAVAQGPEGLTLSWSEVAGSSGYRVYYSSVHDTKSLQETNALAVWEDTTAALHHLQWGKTYKVAVTAFNKDGEESDFSDALEVRMENKSGNNAPVIFSRPVGVVQQGGAYAYALEASDADKDLLFYEIKKGPPSMSVDAAGKISWQPRSGDAGAHTVLVRVSDPDNASDEQTFVLNVLSDEQNIAVPFIDIACSTTTGPAPLSISFSAVAWELRSEQLSYLWDFGDGTTAAEANPTHTFTTKGFYTVELTVTNESGLSSAKSIIVQATDTVQALDPPEVSPNVSGSQVALSWQQAPGARGYRFFIGKNGASVDYDKPVDIGDTAKVRFVNIPFGLYTTVFRSYIAETGETWDSQKVSFFVPPSGKQEGSGLTATLEGVVKDNATGAPLKDANVRFIFYETKTDEEGKFSFAQLPSIKKASVCASANGYGETVKTVTLETGKTASCVFALSPGGSDNRTCPAEQLVPEKTGLLRLLRDRVLAQSPEGRRLTECYYSSAPEIINILQQDKTLRKETLLFLQKVLPIVERAVSGNAYSLTPDIKNKAKLIIEGFKKRGGADFRKQLAEVSAILEKKTIY